MLRNLFFGVFKIGNAWPLACHPTFAARMGPTMITMKMTLVTSTGEEIPVNERILKRKLGGARYQMLTQQIQLTEDPEQLRRRLTALLRPLARDNVALQKATSVRFYKATLVTIPERWMDNPISEERLLDLDLSSARPTARQMMRW